MGKKHDAWIDPEEFEAFEFDGVEEEALTLEETSEEAAEAAHTLAESSEALSRFYNKVHKRATVIRSSRKLKGWR